MSVNKESRNGLASIFGLSKTTIGNPKNYSMLLELLYETNWYNDRPGRNNRERQLWNMRAALVDCFVYDPNGDA